MSHLGHLSVEGSAALVEALESLPKDQEDPVDLCERIAQLLDVVTPLTRREDLPAEDRQILLAFCQSDDRLLTMAELIRVHDLATILARN